MVAKHKTLGERIEEARKARGLSHATAAKAAGMHTTSFQRLEWNQAKPRVIHAEGLSKTLGIPIYELLSLPEKTLPLPVEFREPQIPLLDYAEVAKLSDETVSLTDLCAIEYLSLPIQLDHVSMAFALKVVDNSMAPRIREGSIVLIDLAQFEKIKQDSVVAAITNRGHTVLREYHLKRNGFELRALNGDLLDSKKDGLILLGPATKVIQDV